MLDIERKHRVSVRERMETRQRARNGQQTNGSSSNQGKNGQTNRQMNGKAEKPSVGPQRTGVNRFFGELLMPMFLLTSCPVSVMALWYLNEKCGGSVLEMVNRVSSRGSPSEMAGFVYQEMWAGRWHGTAFAAQVVIGFAAWAMILTRLLPGKPFQGPVTPKGNVPRYYDNGFLYFNVSLVAFFALAYTLSQFGYRVTVVAARFDEILATLNVASLLFCLLLYVKGRWWPSSSDNGTSGNPVFDYYWGTELYPRLAGFDVKQLTNCRFGMMGWALLTIIFCMRSVEVNGGVIDAAVVHCILLVAYLAKFFWWESGYMRTIDIMLDRAGFYLCWGCLCWVPALYSFPAQYLSLHARPLGPVGTAALLVVGLASILVNFLVDEQKRIVRETNGKCSIWGAPAKVIRAEYVTEDGVKQHSLLLVSGWWGVARHVHYVPELMLALCWSLPAQFYHGMPYAYFLFLTALLVHRAHRDDHKCRAKYGHFWDDYCKHVPYKIIPYLY